MDIGNVIIIAAAVFVVLVLLSACCRGLKKAYSMQLTNNEMARRRQAYFMSQAGRAAAQGAGDGRVVRVATIATDGNHENVAYEIYEIQLPSRNPRLPHMHQQYHGRSGGNESRSHQHDRRSRRAPLPPEALTPPPPFRTALEESSPVVNSYSQPIDMEEPPPTYDDYLRLNSSGENLVKEPISTKGRY
ncbi:unnamed protein product [Allacma fusca]|uniref:Uncharacterized protein n=1 Tax=Allacma fusca TaxID=39272 RepID=A0A8J2K7P0_9HEXA|nr:unnamed protein product [Allacma fusca]